jgi:hypothetical protein
MEAKAQKSRRTVWISVSAAVGLIVLYYYSSRSLVDSSPLPAAGPVAEYGAHSLTGPAAMIAPAPAIGVKPAPQAAASALNLAVNGVMITPVSRAALVSVDDRYATLFVEGQEIVDGVVLYALDRDGIVVQRGDTLLRLPLRGARSADHAPGGLPASKSVSTDPALPTLPPPGTEERRIYQSQNRD